MGPTGELARANFREPQNPTLNPARPLTTEELSDSARYSAIEKNVTLRVRHSRPSPPTPPQTLAVPDVAKGMAWPSRAALTVALPRRCVPRTPP
jgi:hypothetical protein